MCRSGGVSVKIQKMLRTSSAWYFSLSILFEASSYRWYYFFHFKNKVIEGGQEKLSHLAQIYMMRFQYLYP